MNKNKSDKKSTSNNNKKRMENTSTDHDYDDIDNKNDSIGTDNVNQSKKRNKTTNSVSDTLHTNKFKIPETGKEIVLSQYVIDETNGSNLEQTKEQETKMIVNKNEKMFLDNDSNLISKEKDGDSHNDNGKLKYTCI